MNSVWLEQRTHNHERNVNKFLWQWLSNSDVPNESFVETKQILIHRTLSRTEGQIWHSVIALFVVYGKKHMSFGTCNFIAEINKSWPRASTQNSCGDSLADGEIIAAHLLGSPLSSWPRLKPGPQHTTSHPVHGAASFSFPNFTEGLPQGRPSICTPWWDVSWLLSFSNTKPN